jgi:class 3 adenylate cyclase
MNDQVPAIYRDRFENLFRVAKKITASLNIGDILEIIRDEVKVTVPYAQEACLILVDPQAPSYTRPLHCAVKRDQVNCHMCKRGNEIVRKSLLEPIAFQCSLEPNEPGPPALGSCSETLCEVALPIFDNDQPLAVLNVVARPGYILNDKDVILLKDLAELASNTIINAKKHSSMAMEKVTLERILGHISTFVPETVRRIVEKNPDAPALEKTEADVSILFLDVADYSRISENLTQDKVNFIIEKYFSSFLDVIYSFNGDVNETAGDGLMAIFLGAEEDNALNAANAALTIKRRTAEINAELAGLFYPIAINMGLNSGIASVGMSRFKGASGTRMTFTASGHVTNVAARIASAAVDGDILVGPETARRIISKIMLFDRGQMSFKNIREKVHVYSLVPPI